MSSLGTEVMSEIRSSSTLSTNDADPNCMNVFSLLRDSFELDADLNRMSVFSLLRDGFELSSSPELVQDV